MTVRVPANSSATHVGNGQQWTQPGPLQERSASSSTGRHYTMLSVCYNGATGTTDKIYITIWQNLNFAECVDFVILPSQ